MAPSERTPASGDREQPTRRDLQVPSGDAPARTARDEAADVGLLATIAANRQLVRHLVDCWNARDFDGYEAALTDDVEVELIPFETTLHGAPTARAHAERWAVAFPDAQLEVLGMRADAEGTVLEFV